MWDPRRRCQGGPRLLPDAPLVLPHSPLLVSHSPLLLPHPSFLCLPASLVVSLAPLVLAQPSLIVALTQLGMLRMNEATAGSYLEPLGAAYALGPCSGLEPLLTGPAGTLCWYKGCCKVKRMGSGKLQV